MYCKYIFFLTFTCQNISTFILTRLYFFQVDGTIIAPTNANVWGRGILQWLDFTKLVGFTIQGNGIVDGRGSVWWQDTTPYNNPIDDEEKLLVPLNNTVGRPPMQVFFISFSPRNFTK